MANDNNNIQPLTTEYHSLLADVCAIIDSTRQQLAATYTNYQLLMYWSIGTRINQDILGGKRAEYGAQIVSTLSTQLQQQYGDEYVERNLRRMMQFAQEVDQQIVSTLSTQLTWSHVIEILPLKEALQREFYLTMASSNKWSVRTLRKEIDGSLYQPFDKLRINSTDTNDNILYIHTSSFKQPFDRLRTSRILCRQYNKLAA